MRGKKRQILLISILLVLFSALVLAFGVTLNTPATNQVIGPTTAGFPLFTVNVSIGSFANITLLNVTIGGTEICSNNTVNLTSYVCTWNTSQTGNGNFTVVASATNSSGATNTSNNTGVIVDSTAPTSTINTANGTNTTDTTPQISFTLTDNIDFTINYTIFVDGTANSQTGGVLNNTATNLNISALAEGTHTIIVEARDDASNRANSTPLTLTVDSTVPAVTLNSPANGSSSSTATQTFNWSVTDNLAVSLSCDLNTDGTVNTAGITSPNGTSTTQAAGFASGTHNWSITCTDSAGNSNTSITRFFTITTTSTANSGGGGGGASYFYNELKEEDESNNPQTTNNPDCTNDWFCQAWSSCLNGKQTRTCAKNDYGCSKTSAKPATTRNCNEQGAVEAEAELETSAQTSEQQNTEESGMESIPGAPIADMAGSKTSGLVIGIILLLVIMGAVYWFGFRDR